MHLEAQSAWRTRRGGFHPSSAVHRSMALLLLMGLAGCHRADSASASGGAIIQITSSSIRDGRIPKQFTCDGADISPQLAWNAPPRTTKNFALILTDPDAPSGTFTHWVLYEIPAKTQSLTEGLPNQAQLPDGSRQGRNDFGKTGYGGPCPPHNSDHHYVFTLYALDTILELQPGATRDQVEQSIKAHILARGEMTARYAR